MRTSKFVNYKKRSITLPGGCKNLIDVLQPHGLRKPLSVSKSSAVAMPLSDRPAVTREESFMGGLADIDKYVAMVFESHALSFVLMVTPPDEQFTLDLARTENGTMKASVFVQDGTGRERAVRSFLAHRGFNVPEQSGTPPMFVPGVPVDVIFEILPLPSEARHLSQLLSDLLRVFELSDDLQLLCFRYYEIRSAE